jgi:hypothetical protein
MRSILSVRRLSLATFAALASFASGASAQVAPSPSPSNVWHFDEGIGAHVAIDSVSGQNGTGAADALWLAGEAPALGTAHDKLVYMYPSTGYDDPNQYIDFGNSPGAFAVGDFTVMHWFVTSYAVPHTAGDVVGNRATWGHGNFFGVRMRGDGIICVEVDQDEYGTNYVGVVGEGHPVNDTKLHHLAYVRSGGTLSLFIDGVLVAASANASGQPTYLNGANPFRLGRSTPFTYTTIPAFYDDLKIYHQALNAAQIQAAAAGTL